MNCFAQLSGRWYDGKDVLLGVGYAGGDCGNVPDGKNNPQKQDIPNVGPLPCGFYTIQAPYDHPRCGLYFLPLKPNPSNVMFGRGGFGVHGDLISAAGQFKASDGCIVLSRDVREAIWNGGDRDLHVVSGIVYPDVDGEISV